MRKAILAGLTAIALLGSCATTDKCKDPKYLYKEGEHPETHMAPKLPEKPIPKDYTFNGPNANDRLTPYANSIKIPEKQTHEISVNMYPSRANKWIKKIEKEEKTLTAKYNIIFSEEKENIKTIYKTLNEGPHIIYIGPKEKEESVFKMLSEVFIQSRVDGEKFYPLPKDFPGGIGDVDMIFNKGLEILLEKEMQMSGE